jgi:hypothetical protein
VTTNQCIPVKNALDRSAAEYCAYKIMHVLSVVFCVVEAVRKFNFSVVINQNLINGYLWKEGPMFLTTPIYFSRPSTQGLGDSTHSVQVKCILLSKGYCLIQVFHTR